METKTVRQYIKENLTVKEYVIASQNSNEDWDRTLSECNVGICHKDDDVIVVVQNKEQKTALDNYLEELIKPASKELLEISRELTELANKLKQLSVK